jgi:hypothetical protein
VPEDLLRSWVLQPLRPDPQEKAKDEKKDIVQPNESAMKWFARV